MIPEKNILKNRFCDNSKCEFYAVRDTRDGTIAMMRAESKVEIVHNHTFRLPNILRRPNHPLGFCDQAGALIKLCDCCKSAIDTANGK